MKDYTSKIFVKQYFVYDIVCKNVIVKIYLLNRKLQLKHACNNFFLDNIKYDGSIKAIVIN